MPKIKITGLPKFQGTQGSSSTPASGIPPLLARPTDTPAPKIPMADAANPAWDPNDPLGVNKMFKDAAEGKLYTPSQQAKCPDGYKKNNKGECVPEGGTLQKINDSLQAGLLLGNAFVQENENRKIERDFKRKEAQKRFTGIGNDPGKQFTMGHVETVSGVEFPSLMTPPNEGMFSNAFYGSQYGQMGGEFTGEEYVPRTRIRILETPDALPEQMKYGGQSSYGLDLGWKIGYTDMAKTSSDHITGSMSQDDNAEEPPILEAEDNETLYKPGDKTLHRITGKRHSEGGVALNATQVGSQSTDEPSFIFSDTKALKIKDKEVLKNFGIKKFAKGGVTPAEVSKKFDLNKFKAILEDPTKDLLAKTTAQLMMNKNEKKLAELAAYQESMKGVEPPPFVERKMQNARLGGFIPKYQNAGTTPTDPPQFSENFEDLKTNLLSDDAKELRTALYDKYKKTNPNTSLSEDDYINNFLDFQEHVYALNKGFKKSELNTDDWDTGTKNVKYEKSIKKLGFDPLDEDRIRLGQTAFRNYIDLLRDPDFVKKYGTLFTIDPQGKPDTQYKGRAASNIEGWFGNTTNRSMVRAAVPKKDITVNIPPTTTPPEKPRTPKYICVTDASGKQTPQKTDGIGYDTPEEAMKNCGRLPVRAPYDYLLPDKLNMLAQAAIYPEMILPFAPDVQFTPGQLNLEDWRAKAAQRFSTQYAAPAAQLAQFTGPQGLTANLSALAGQTAQQMAGEDIAPTISRNVDRANQFGQQELARQDVVNRFNVGQQMERYKGWATARQQYQNSLRKYLKDNSDAFTRAWNNRMTLGDINDSQRNFYKSATSGRNYFYNPNTRGIAGLQGGSNTGGSVDDIYKKNYESLSYIKDEKARVSAANKLTQTEIENMQSSDYSNPYDFYDRRRSRRGLFSTR